MNIKDITTGDILFLTAEYLIKNPYLTINRSGFYITSVDRQVNFIEGQCLDTNQIWNFEANDLQAEKNRSNNIKSRVKMVYEIPIHHIFRMRNAWYKRNNYWNFLNLDTLENSKIENYNKSAKVFLLNLHESSKLQDKKLIDI